MAASTTLNQSQRALRARLAANERWSQPEARTDQADKRLAWFADQVDPERRLPEHERIALAKQRRRAYMQRLALNSSKARAARKAGDGNEAA
ncbi:MAG TPA: hypothetical protein VH916_13470 [Dehalococcoidia bacterium]